MKKHTFISAVLLTLLCSVLCSCQSNGYYQHQAAESARRYLLENTPAMPLMEQEYIKFNRPFFLVSEIQGSYRTGQTQVCICWMTPDNPEVYMVFGVSGMRMIDWSPTRIIRKKFSQVEKSYILTAAQAADNLIQNQFDLLDTVSVNNIRFTLPGVWKCKFPLNLNPDSQLTAEELAQAEQLPRYVLAWKLTKNDEVLYAVYGGTAQDDKLTGFKAYFSGIYSPETFQSFLLDSKPLIYPFAGPADK